MQWSANEGGGRPLFCNSSAPVRGSSPDVVVEEVVELSVASESPALCVRAGVRGWAGEGGGMQGRAGWKGAGSGWASVGRARDGGLLSDAHAACMFRMG